jgi:hypothetical protein
VVVVLETSSPFSSFCMVLVRRRRLLLVQRLSRTEVALACVS